MPPDADTLSHFGALDELIQAVYAGIERFVLLSAVDDASWTVHLGLQGPHARWWRGEWRAADVRRVAGPAASDALLAALADKLVRALVGGHARVPDWAPEPGAQIHLALASPTDSARDRAALRVLWDIALGAQGRRCRLHGGGPAYPAPAPAATSSSAFVFAAGASPAAARPSSGPSGTTAVPAASKEKEKITEKEKEKEKAAPQTSARTKRPDAAKPPRAALRGASLANPNKKARKYEAVEFESDGE